MTYLVQNVSGRVQSMPKTLETMNHDVNNWAIGQIDHVADSVINLYQNHSDVFTIISGPSAFGSPGAMTPNEVVVAGPTGDIAGSATDGITAHAGGGQAAATQLTAKINRVTVVATVGDSVKLPAATAGANIMVINHGANAMQVFGAGTDTIDDVATATGVSQMANSLVYYTCSIAGLWYSNGLAVGFGGPGLQTMSYTNGIAAFAGGGQTSATVLTSMVNRITTVATAGDSVKLPAAIPGLVITVLNDATLPAQVFGTGTDTVNDVAAATGVTQMAQSVVVYTCTVAGLWTAEGVGTGYNGSFMTQSYANALTANAGGVQAGATPITTSIARFTTVAAAGNSAVLPTAAGGLEITVINAGANSMNVFPAGTDAINAGAASAAFVVPTGAVVTFYSTVAGVWHTIYYASVPVPLAYNTNAATTAATLTAANVTGGTTEVVLNMTGTLGAGANAQMPTVASLVAAIPNAAAGQTYKLRIINSSAGAFAWTVTTNTGWTLTGTMTIAQNTFRDFVVTLTSLSAAVLQQVGTGTTS